MSKGIESSVYYFAEKGALNTDKTLEIALAVSREQGIGKIVVATSTGKTALKLHDMAGQAIEIIAVTFGAGSRYRKEVEEFQRNYDELIQKGIRVVRGIHGLSGTERSFETRYKTGFIPLNIIADTLRMFSQGVKVCVEIGVMAAEHGFISPEEDVVAIGGSGGGADTAVILKPGYAANVFETRIKRLLCMPG